MVVLLQRMTKLVLIQPLDMLMVEVWIGPLVDTIMVSSSATCNSLIYWYSNEHDWFVIQPIIQQVSHYYHSVFTGISTSPLWYHHLPYSAPSHCMAEESFFHALHPFSSLCDSSCAAMLTHFNLPSLNDYVMVFHVLPPHTMLPPYLCIIHRCVSLHYGCNIPHQGHLVTRRAKWAIVLSGDGSNW